MSPSRDPILFIPGPVEVDPELRQMMSAPLVGHRSAGFKECVQRVSQKLGPLFRHDGPAFFENCPGTALMEAGIRNLVRSRVLHLSCGAFGERWAKISRALGREVVHIEEPWGQAQDPDTLRQTLREQGPFEAVCLTHNETSTAVINPLAELAAVVREEQPDCLILVDAVTSLAGAQLEFDAWGIDLAFAGTQKCLALPPGLGVFAVSQRALAKAETVPDRGFLLDFCAAPERFAKGATPATPCVPLVFALERQLDRIAAEGLEARWQRHLDMREAVDQWTAVDGGYRWLVEDAARRSPTVSAIRWSGRDPERVLAAARDAGFVIGKGYGKLAEHCFRIGHMGDHSVERVRQLLQALSSVSA